MHGHTSEYEQERRAKLQKLRELGVDPYGQRQTDIRSLAEAKHAYSPEMGHDSGPAVKVAGRIVLKRDFGKKLSFLTLRDDSGDLQVALDAKRLDERAWQVRDLLDLGDQIVAAGNLGTTKTGEVTIWATTLSMACKALLPPPAKHEGLSDVEIRYRERYVDLWANPQVMRIMQLRLRIVEEIRAFLRARGFSEVETPMLQVLHGGAAARPFVTRSNALDIPLYLRIAPELYLKRLLVGGFRKVFELNRNFRNEGISPRHNPEFTMLEIYEAFGSHESMMDLIEEMICHCAQQVLGTLELANRDINLARPWRRMRMPAIVEERTGWRFNKEPLSAAQVDDLRSRNPGKDLKLHGSPAEQLVELFEKLVEPTLLNPTFITHIPSVIIPLARENREDPYFADAYELIANGVEIGPGYTELNDPDVQARHFAHQVGEREEQQQTDNDFLNALKYGMPPAGGLGMGVDRLVSMLTGAESLRDVILFPLMRPERETERRRDGETK